MEHSLTMGTEVIEDSGGREPQGFLGNLQEAQPLQEETVWVDRANKVYNIQIKQGFLRRVADQGGWEKASW